VEIDRRAEEASERDPRTSPWGYHVGSTFVLDSASLFFWFGSQEELLDHLFSVEPLNWGYEMGEELEAYQRGVAPLIARARTEGLTADVCESLNTVTKESFAIAWWGTLDDLLSGSGEFERQIRKGFIDGERDDTRIGKDEMNEFVDYLKGCSV
jgi:hypothetical protein